LTDVKETRAFKQAVLTNVFAGALPAPRELERVCQAHLANREINTAIDRLKGAGAQVEYMSLDVRKADQVRTALDAIRQRYGPIRGIIHGAGILADRLIVDKTPEQFNRVFDTKITGLHTLLTATQQDDLKQIILFSSVAARTGNRGQVDYAMANEALNKVAWQETRRRPDCNVVAVNWGPWDGGMVSPSLKKEFRRHDIPLIDLKQGADCLFMEMTANRSRPAEIVVGAMMPANRPEAMPPPSDPLALSFKREIDIETVPVLESHVLDGKPVVPLALMTEWFAHGALHANPGLMLHGFDDLRVLKGIRLAGKKKLIRLMAGKAHRNRAIYEVPLELRNGVKDGREVVHSNTKAILGDSPLEPPPFEKPDQLEANGYYRSMSEVYEKILFHGPDLRGIEEIISLSPHGMIARVASAPVPEQWIRNPHRTRWIGDPLALDCAFQMASLWCYEQTGSVSLPSYCAAYRQYAQRFPEGGLTAVLLVTAQTDRKIRADITFVDGDDQVVAQIFGYEAVMDTALIKAFKPQLAASA
jgi:NAD(P)-dependent dehydrogenase (short-subunit alcohol dehydrogenase family)